MAHARALLALNLAVAALTIGCNPDTEKSKAVPSDATTESEEFGGSTNAAIASTSSTLGEENTPQVDYGECFDAYEECLPKIETGEWNLAACTHILVKCRPWTQHQAYGPENPEPCWASLVSCRDSAHGADMEDALLLACVDEYRECTVFPTDR